MYTIPKKIMKWFLHFRWGLPLAWALSALPLTPLLLGAVLQLAWIRRGVPFTMVHNLSLDQYMIYLIFQMNTFLNLLLQHLKRLVKPTDRYYRYCYYLKEPVYFPSILQFPHIYL